METSKIARRQGTRLTKVERDIIIAKIIEALTKGYYTDLELSRQLDVSRDTIARYRETADRIIATNKIDRNIVRNLQIKRTYTIIENLMNDLKRCESIKEKTLIYNQIAKFSQHLALICGLNVETHVNVDHKQLVIIRANPEKHKAVREVIEHE